MQQARNESPAADREEDRLDVGQLIGNLEAHRALSGHHRRIREGMEIDRSCLLRNVIASKFDSSQSAPTIRTSAPHLRIFSTFSALTVFGAKIVADTPARRAARATARPWFPPEAVTIPLASSARGVVMSLFIAPRALNDPVGWRHSSLSHKSASVAGAAHCSARNRGVRRMNYFSRRRGAGASRGGTQRCARMAATERAKIKCRLMRT